MKKFICTLTLQPRAEGNQALLYTYDRSCGFSFETAIRNPIIPFILMNSEEGEHIGVYLITEEKSICTDAGKIHLKNFTEELETIKKERGFSYDIMQLTLKSPQDSTEYMRLVQSIIGIIEDSDVVFTDITYGRKAVPIATFIALNYAYRIRKDVEIGAVSYGEAHNPGPEGKDMPTIFDLSSFFLLNDTISNMVEAKDADKNIKTIVNKLIHHMERM